MKTGLVDLLRIRLIWVIAPSKERGDHIALPVFNKSDTKAYHKREQFTNDFSENQSNAGTGNNI